MLFAQFEVSSWTNIIAAVANIGFSAVVAWFLLTKALPRIQDSFLEELRDARRHYDMVDEKRRNENKDALQVVVAHCEKESIRHVEAAREESTRHSEVVKVELGLHTMALKDQREVLEEVRDALRDQKHVLEDVRQALRTIKT